MQIKWKVRWLIAIYKNILDKVFESGPIETFERLSSTNFTWFILEYFGPYTLHNNPLAMIHSVDSGHGHVPIISTPSNKMKCNKLKIRPWGMYPTFSKQEKRELFL